MAISHADCTHPRTPAGRRACRSGASTPSQAPIDRDIYRAQANQAARRRMDVPRIQPRRSGARVSAGSSTCVQAALHTSRGLCACGHMTGEFRVPA